MSASKLAARPVLVYRFGPYELDTTRKELSKFGLRMKLERKPLQLLTALVERPGEVVMRGDLQRLLWGEDLFVDFEKGLNVAVAKLRATLNDSPEKPTYIETVAGEGYRFIAEIERVFATARSSASEQLVAEVHATPSLNQLDTRVPRPEESAQQPSVGVPPPWLQRWKTRRGVAVAACVAIAAIVIGKLVWTSLQQPVPVHAGKMMLVVLPFENLSEDPGQEYFSDGITEELSTQLGNLNPQRLGVIGRTSAMAYKHSTKTIGQIGKDLGVNYVLEGSVRRDGSRIRVTAQLVEVSDQAHVWAQDYDRDVHDLLQVEDEVATNIAGQVGISIAIAKSGSSSHLHAPTSEAHEAYLIGRYYWYKRTPEGWSKSRDYFRLATKKDPQYAAAYAGLAECAGRQEALAAARKAVELDPTSGEAYTALGWVQFFKEWDYIAAAEALKTAIQFDRNYAPAHHIYSGVLEVSGHFQEAIEEEKQAVLLDPLALIFRASLAEELSTAGENERAVEQINQIFAIDPKYPKAHETLGNINLRRGMYKEAINEFEASERYGGVKERAAVGYAYARLGERQTAFKILSELQALEKRKPSGDLSANLALVEIGLQHPDAALAWLDKEYEQHDDDGPWSTKVDPIFAPLRSDARFQQLMRHVRFPK
jgi:TolB-like protein/DNA-binding winged helix-turn-helix (wHTH) protein/Tfp pilus assembly protein PilF